MYDDDIKPPDISGIKFLFSRSGNESISLFLDNIPNLEDLCRKYWDVLRQIENSNNRQLGEDRKIKLIKNLDDRRKKIHREAAEEISEYLEEEGVKISEDAAKKLFGAFGGIWLTSTKDELIYDNIFLEKKDIEKLKKMLRKNLELVFL